MALTLRLPSKVYRDARQHLLPNDSVLEQAAFLFARYAAEGGGNAAFAYVGWLALKANDFASQNQDYLELTDAARARVIKRAHDLDTCLVELHSHPGPYPAAFSPSDIYGFEEFVPHVRWRLKGKPYAAVVIAPSGFDALAWDDATKAPVQLHTIDTGAETLQATGLTLKWRREVRRGAL